MKVKSYFTRILFSILITLFGLTSYAQVTITMDTVYCGTLTTTLHASVVGDTPLSSGIVEDDIYAPTPYPLGFTFNFYGTPYTECLIGANGNLCFDYSLAGAYDPWPISAALLGNTSVLNCICGPWCDIYVPAYGIITYSNDGIAPHRRFVVNFCGCAMFSCTTQWITTQMVLNESTDIIDVYVAHKTFCTSWNGGYAIIGVQNSAGTDAVTAPGRDYPATYNCTDEAWQFTPISGGTTYSVSPVTFSPIPYGSTHLYWYDSATHAFIDSGSTLTVSATTSGTYTCAALGCGDTSFSYIHVTPAGSGVSLYSFTGTGVDVSSYTNPTSCGTPDGTMKLKGHGMTPGYIDTVTFYLGGVLQPTVTLTVAPDSSVTVSGLCAGTYTNIQVAQNSCPSAPLGPLTLVDPAIGISSVTVINPTQCGGTGSLVLNGLYPGKSFTVNFDKGGVPQTAVTATSSGSGTVTLTGLCAGVYSNIVASFTGCDVCTTPAAGPYTLVSPAISISSTSFTEPTACGITDGTITLYGLYPGQTYTVTYDSNGVANIPVTLTATGSGTITITGLGGPGPGAVVTYTNIIASFTACNTCTTPGVGPITLTTPTSAPVIVAAFTNPTQCGYHDGAITLRSVIPYSSDTIYYSFNGTPQIPIVTYANSDSTISLPGLWGGTYTNFIIKVGPCLESVSGEAILVTPKLFANFSDLIHLGCHGDTVDFYNSSTSPGAILPIPFTYSWNFGDGNADTSANPYHIYQQQGTYTVTLTAGDHFCFDDTSLVVSMVHPLSAGFAYSPAPAILCQNNTVAFTDTSIGNISTYAWYYGNGATSNGVNGSYTYKNPGAYNAMLVVTDFVPCKDTARLTVQVDSQSNLAINITDSVICRSSDISFTGIYTSSGNTGITWNFGDGDSVKNLNPVIRSYDATGTFTVTAMAYYRACHDTGASKVVVVYPQPSLYLGPADTTVCSGNDPLILADKINAGDPNASWTWSTGQKGSQIAVTQPGVYSATVNIDGCRNSYTVTVKNDCYLNIPNIFTPNGDGVNDYFFPRTLLTSGLISFNMNIYNRWGELIYTSTSLDGRGWDGKLNDNDQPEGVYIYMIDATFKDGQKEHHQGNVTLIR